MSTYAPFDPNAQSPPKKSNRWLLFGCLGCGGLLLICGGVGAGFFYWAYNLGINNDGVKMAKSMAESSPEVQTAVGSPITFGFPKNVEQQNQKIHYEIPMSGPNGSATLIADVRVESGTANFVVEKASAVLPDGKTIDLK